MKEYQSLLLGPERFKVGILSKFGKNISELEVSKSWQLQFYIQQLILMYTQF
jgi:hypothetical protein